jgi:hypothetical protein
MTIDDTTTAANPGLAVGSPPPGLPFNAAAAIRAATKETPQTIDEFGDDQFDLNALLNLPPDAILEWVDSIPPRTARPMFERLGGIANEHRRRAAAADNLVEQIRSRLNETAQYSIPPTPPATRG